MRLQLPDKTEAQFTQAGADNDNSAWKLGELTEVTFQLHTVQDEDGKDILIDRNTEEPITAWELYNICATAANKSPHSMRDYRGSARSVPRSVHEKYPLGRHHWKAISPKCKSVQELEKMADIVLSWSDGVPSVAYVRARLAGKDGAPAKWEGRLKRATSTCKRLEADESAPSFVRRAAELFIRRSVHPPLP